MSANKDLSISIKRDLAEFKLSADFSVPGQGVAAIFGPSGSGKTSLLRSIAGLDPVQGKIQILDSCFQDTVQKIEMPAHEREIGYVLQKPHLFSHLSVKQNLEYALKRSGTPKAEQQHTFNDTVELVGIEYLLDRWPQNLSGGEGQRVAIARALLTAPKLLLLDEPFSALDRTSRERILHLLQGLLKRLKIPVLYVTHDLGEAIRFADHMVVLNKGNVIAYGKMEDMLSRMDLGPALGRFQASSVINAKVQEHDQQYQLTRVACDGQIISIPMIEHTVGADIRLRIRVRDVAVSLDKPQGISIQNVLSAQIEALYPEPDTPYAEILFTLGKNRIKARITRHSMDRLSLEPDMDVYLLIKSISFDGLAKTSIA